MDRRSFLSIPCLAVGAQKRPLRILLRSSWQSVNIGDIGHTPGALSLIEKHLPDAEVTLWPGKLGHGSRDLLTRGYPRLRIAESPEAIAEAKAWADIYVSGSGSGFPASQHAIEFHRTTGKPVGVLGVSLDPVSGFGEGRVPEGGTLRQLREKALALPPDHLKGDLRYILDRAAFFFCRDTITRDYLRAQRVKTPVLEFGPDAQLGMHLRDDSKGFAYLAQQGLEEGKFICVIPRLRYTPYYRIRSEPRVATDDVKDAINDRTTTADHAKLREMITAYVRQTGGKVMACAEMTYQVEMAKTELVDPLPPDVRRNIVWRDTYWLPDEAASIYAKALAVISVECHSPLIALRQGTPAFYVRQPTDTCKGQMYRDVGADEWFFEIEEASGATLWAALERIVRNRKRAKEQARAVMARVEVGQKRMMRALREGA